MWDPFLAIALKTSLLMSAAGVASALLARQSAAIRHLVWVSALALALLMPLATALVPSFAVVPNPWSQAEQFAADAPRSAQLSPVWISTIASYENSGQRLTEAVWPAVLAVWLAGVLLILLRDVAGHAGLSRWSRRARPLCSPHWTAALRLMNGERRAGMRVLESDHVTSPCTWGFVRPVLVLPAAALDWSEERRRYALTHELAHIRRGDYFSASIARLACAMHWYNPLIWYAAGQAHKFRECACDDAVLRAGGLASDYAQLLVDIAAQSSGICGSLRPAMGMAQRSPLHDRVKAILDPHKARAEQNRLSTVATIAPLACIMALLASATLAEPAKVQPVEPVRVHVQPLATAAAVSDAKPIEHVHARRHRSHAILRPVPAAPDVASLSPPRGLAALPPLPSIPAVPALPAISSTPSIKPVPPVPAVPAVPAE